MDNKLRIMDSAFPTCSGDDTIGGLTRLEWMAGQVASGWFADMNVVSIADSVPKIVKIANQILAECDAVSRRELEGDATD